MTLALMAFVASPAFAAKPATNGFDEFGYNRTARIFNGTVMDWCMEKVDSQSWCDTYYGPWGDDKLVMKWNAAWDTCNDSGDCTGAWTSNEYNGMKDGSDSVWHYKIVWVPTPCGADYEPLDNGGYCIWGHYEVLMDQGKDSSGHAWYAHGIPTGYGAY